MRLDLDASAADAGAPTNDPQYADRPRDASPGSPQACGVAYVGFGTRAAPADVARFTAMVAELREHEWRQHGQRMEHKARDDGRIDLVRTFLKQRGWTLAAEYRGTGKDRVITAVAFEDVCMKKHGAHA